MRGEPGGRPTRHATGEAWQLVAGRVFDGMGSMGNGAAMRAAPIGVIFAGDITATVENARRAAAVTHAHREGQAGAIVGGIVASGAPSRGIPNAWLEAREPLDVLRLA